MDKLLSKSEQDAVKVLLKISDIRKEKNITQKQLSELTGITQNKISNYENFRIFPTLDTLVKLTSALDVKLSIVL